MTRKATTRRPHASSGAMAADVESFFATLDHPHAAALRALRDIIRAADASIGEGIKWNVPSFRTTDYFATMHVRAKPGVGVILHFGAKKRTDLPPRAAIADPSALLNWLADDRAVVMFRDLGEVKARRAALTRLVREWIRHV